MIIFSSKITWEIDKKILYFDDEMKLREQIKELFQINQCEVILIYEEERYCGYIESENIYDIVMPEFYFGYEPFEFDDSDRLIEDIIEYKDKIKRVKRQIRIPLKNRSADRIRDFIEDGEDVFKLSKHLCAYERYENAPFLLESHFDKSVVLLGELNEFTYRCLKILEKRKQKYFVKGKYWNHINIQEEVFSDVKESEILECDYILVASTIESWVKREISDKIDSMKDKGINAYKVIYPLYEELSAHGEVEEELRHAAPGGNWDLTDKTSVKGEPWINVLMKTECCSTKKELLSISRSEQYGEGKANIYLAGPCIVYGTTAEISSFAYMLYQKVKDLSYSVKKIVVSKHDISLIEKIDSLDFKDNDIFIFLTDSHMYEKKEEDIDLLYDFNNRPIDSCVFLDEPIHALRRGNEMVIEKLYPLIKRCYRCNEGENLYIHTGRPYLSQEKKEELQNYINSYQVDITNNSVGCIVMNANPFTQGHLYLVENAAKDVDKLLVFVVEEDLSEFTFSDRYWMVSEGTKHLHNICVIPSGRFILSSQTFGSYFEKDEKQNEEVDAAFDISFFGAYIAPAFGISKRFVGEEPKDSVTRQYNEEMKRKLPVYGIEVIEIPRKEVQGEIISATIVRKLYEKKEWEKLSVYLPDTTLDYIIKNNVVMRDKKNIRLYQDIPSYLISKLKKVVSQYEKVIFYAAGRDAKGLYGLLNMDEREKVILVDKNAKKQEISFEGKQVYAPEVLLEEFKDFPILITSTQFGKEIYEEFMEHGIGFSRVIQNIYAFS